MMNKRAYSIDSEEELTAFDARAGDARRGARFFPREHIFRAFAAECALFAPATV
jgi:hypothetical protein